jgi:HEAT repeat protein
MFQPPPLPRTLPAALRDLGDPSPAVRASAAADLLPHADGDRDQVIGALRAALSDSHRDVRAAAAWAMGEAGLDETLDDLVRAADDPDVLVVQRALEALGAIDDPRSTARLERARRDERPEARFQAVLALPRRLDDREADAMLASAIDDPDDTVRHIALRVAEERWPGPTDAAPRTAQLARAALDASDPSVRVAAALLLAARGDAGGADVLLGVIEQRLRPREIEDEAAAVEAAGAVGLRAAIAGLERRAYGVGRLLRERCSFHARVSLARMGHDRARAGILGDLDGWTISTRNEAVMAAGRARLAEARPLLEALRGRPDRADEGLVNAALEALGSPG